MTEPREGRETDEETRETLGRCTGLYGGSRLNRFLAQAEKSHGRKYRA